MSKYSELEEQINNILFYHQKELDSFTKYDSSKSKECIEKSEELLLKLGYSLPDKRIEIKPYTKPVVVVPSWETLCKEAESVVGSNCSIEDLFSEEELTQNKLEIKLLNKEFNQVYKLDKFDVMISVIASIVSSLVDILFVGIPEKTHEGIRAGTLSNYIRDYFDKKYPEEEMAKLANNKISKVPFDAQDNRNTIKHVEGLSAYYHRLLSLGHDPILGFIFGVADIMNGTMTTIDKTGKIVCQVMENYADRKESDVFSALLKLILHFKSDITTSMGLPAPFMSLFNFLQIGKIGEYEQTIAEIVQGMYYEGYDFIHFCSMSIPVMISEVIVRLGYFLKSRKEGKTVKESIPFSLDREKHPKLATMLFIAHSATTAINAGKVWFTKNPMAINYPQWIAFAKYSYKQLKWVLIAKPQARAAYVEGKIDEEMSLLLDSVNESFEDFSKDYIIVFE